MRRSLLLILFTGLTLVTSGAVSLRKPQAVTYYIDSAAGNDACDGKSKKQAWKSLSRVENLSLSAGDKILLRRGSVFHEMFVIDGTLGSKEKPVLVSTYGKGEKPRIIAPDGSQQAVRILKCSFITVEDLDLSNLGTDSEMRDRIGVNVHLQDYGEAFDTVLKGLDIHDVNGRLWKGEGAGVAIRFTMNKDSVCNWWTVIRYNYSHDNDGGFLLICDDGSARKTFSAGNGGTRIYDNILCRGKRPEPVPDQDIRFLSSDNWGGFAIGVQFRDNLFYSEEKEARFAPSGKDGGTAYGQLVRGTLGGVCSDGMRPGSQRGERRVPAIA
ncbi:MAG: hypothetical protein IKH49_03190 [Bacteroidales bacterium]|nr:hypothetical protein [Bacteroidales bacterium]